LGMVHRAHAGERSASMRQPWRLVVADGVSDAATFMRARGNEAKRGAGHDVLDRRPPSGSQRGGAAAAQVDLIQLIRVSFDPRRGAVCAECRWTRDR
jgi:hypothetical protein